MPAAAPAGGVTAEIAVLKYVNLALMQNGLPVLQDLRLENGTDAPLKDVICSFSSDDGLVVPTQLVFREIGAGESAVRPNPGILLNARRILEVGDDAVPGSIRMTVLAQGETVCTRTYPVTILPADQWTGVRPYAELLSAFVLPNADLVCRLQAEAAREIEAATGSSALEGYQSGKRRALEICAAVYAAVQKLGLSYGNPPSSFGEPGQKIRLPQTVGKYRIATCIETSLLMAAVLEKCGLHPVLILSAEHCHLGCHLVEESFPDVVTRSVQSLRKRAALDEFVSIETTKATGNSPFNEAERVGRALLDDEAGFVCAIDVVRSRESGIRPLAFDSGFDGDYAAAGREVAAERNGGVRELRDSVDLSALRRDETTRSRIDRWTQKLLDFSARNRLLNIPRTSRQVIRLLCGDVGDLEDRISSNRDIAIRSIEDAVGEKALDDLLNGRMTGERCAEIAGAELSHGRLCVALPSRDVRRRLTDLLHDARTDLEESGVNTLFLTIGELQWTEPGGGAGRKSYRAPILMVPVRLVRASIAEGVKMQRLDEETTLNTTLVEFLRTQFNLSLPGLDPLPADDSGVDVPLVLQIIRQAVKPMEGWEVFDEATVGCFSFGKFVMWKDVTDRAEELRRNPLVNHLVGGGGSFDDGVEVFPADEVSRHIKPGELFCPVSYDSSQLTAVLYSEMGKSFVLHGPPGTGKSQTITNIIAHNLAKGRRVLFVSEKKAALDVVKDRLDRIGLTPFCLELHSNKTEKSRFYGQIKEALEVPERTPPAEWDQVVAEFEKVRDELLGYIGALHRPYPNGLTAYACFDRAIGRGGRPAHPELLNVDTLGQSQEAYRDTRRAVQDLLTQFRAVSEKALAATPGLTSGSWTPELERELAAAAEETAAAADALVDGLRGIYEAVGLSDDWTQTSVAALADVLETFACATRVNPRFLRRDLRSSPVLLRDLQVLLTERRARAAELGAYRLDRLAELDFDGIARRLEENGRAFFVLRFFRNRALLKELEGIVRTGATRPTVSTLASDLPRMRAYVDAGRAFAEKAGNDPDELADVGGGLKEASARARELWKAFGVALENYTRLVVPASVPADLRAVPDACRDFVENIGDLRGVLRYRAAKARAAKLGAGAFADFIMAEDDGALDVERLFDEAYAARMLDALLAGTPVLAEFSGMSQDERIARFRELNGRYAELSRGMVFAKLAAALPRRRSGPCPEGSELGMLKRECEKKSRQKAVRQMLAESKTLIPALKPCFLMSPLSVAQYLPVDSEPFDLVVFDEASQIPVWDAIGVIARGRQLVVVGDPKQMPPTNFFQKGEAGSEEDDTEEVVADQESILDECLVAGVSSAYLSWHYRSRHESLIAFSNEHYYSGRLCTFPSAVSSPRLGVKFMFVPGGVFAKAGKGPRVNAVEAAALVDYVCAEVRKPGYRRRSVGVVTFSMPQQKLIRAMLEERRSADPELERLLPDEGEGACFVKNLENVQGDESDVILFSVGYAPDENGRFTMNFGPLNLSGGERRLNVAITRAKEQVVVFSSIHASQIDAGEDGRTKAVGASHLKDFLDYAERGGPADGGRAGGPSGGGFCATVAEFLSANGYVVDRNVGCGDHRVAIAVRNPDDPASYLMGVECDGPSYAELRTVQDRDVNRAGVLRGLGWNTCRVWSVDWALDRARSERRLLDLLERARREPQAPVVAAQTPAKPDAVPGPPAEASPAPRQTQPTHPEYRVWRSRPVSRNADFYARSSLERIARMVADVVAQEGPVCETVLRRRVCRVWGLTRMTENVHRVFDDCRPAGCPVTTRGAERVYWPQGVSPDAYRDFRVPSPDPDSRRTLEEIPPEEVANAMRETLADFGACPVDDLYRETLRIFGLATLTAKARRLLDTAHALLAD